MHSLSVIHSNGQRQAANTFFGHANLVALSNRTRHSSLMKPRS
jgi:hypothetical protein